MTAVGLYIGRFQPFHLGHLEVVKLILSKVDELIIVVGSAQYSHTKSNPFTVGERIRMIRESLKEAKINLDRVQITPITDVNVHGIWVHHISLYVGKIDTVFSNDPLTSQLFNEARFRVDSIPFFKREVYSATEIRNRILTDHNWRELVPKSVSNIIDSIKGVERMMTLLHTDNPTI
ncbi:nicotinamide-nucleotide adenylyltransferase [Thermoproteota archaeon]